MDDAKSPKPQKSAAIKLTHVVALKKGKPVGLSLESGELLVRLEEISLLHKQVVVSVQAVGQVTLPWEIPAGLAVYAVTEAIYKRLYQASAN